MEIKGQRILLPSSLERLQEVVMMCLRLPALLELRVTHDGVDVKRGVSDGELVVPETIRELGQGAEPPQVDTEFLLRALALEELPFEPDRHPLHTFRDMMDRVSQIQQLYPVLWLSPRGDSLDAYMALPQGTMPRMLFGLPVHYVDEDQLPGGRLLLVGSTTRYVVDASYGVTADIGG